MKESVLQARTLSDVALVLTEAAKNLSQIAKYLADMCPSEWMTAKQAATYLGCELVKAFEKIPTWEGSPDTTSLHAPHGTTALSSMPGSQDAESPDDTPRRRAGAVRDPGSQWPHQHREIRGNLPSAVLPLESPRTDDQLRQ